MVHNNKLTDKPEYRKLEHETPPYLPLLDEMFGSSSVEGSNSYCSAARGHAIDINSDEEDAAADEDGEPALGMAGNPTPGSTPRSLSTPHTPMSCSGKRASSTSTTGHSPSKPGKKSKGSAGSHHTLSMIPVYEAYTARTNALQKINDVQDKAEQWMELSKKMVAEVEAIGITGASNPRLYAAIGNVLDNAKWVGWFFASDAEGKKVVLETAAAMVTVQDPEAADSDGWGSIGSNGWGCSNSDGWGCSNFVLELAAHDELEDMMGF